METNVPIYRTEVAEPPESSAVSRSVMKDVASIAEAAGQCTIVT
jgi:hypothetical protein